MQDRRRFWDLQGFQTLERVWRGFGDLPDRAVRARQLSKFDPLQIVADVAPGVTARLLGDALEQQRQHRQRDVRVEAMWRPVIHGAQLQAALQRAPRDFDPLQLLVAEREIGGRERIVVRVNDELAVEPLEFGNASGIDPWLAGFGQSQVTTVAA